MEVVAAAAIQQVSTHHPAKTISFPTYRLVQAKLRKLARCRKVRQFRIGQFCFRDKATRESGNFTLGSVQPPLQARTFKGRVMPLSAKRSSKNLNVTLEPDRCFSISN